MIGRNKATMEERNLEYQEVRAKPSIYITLAAVLMCTAPLLWLNYKTGVEGVKVADITRFSNLVGLVDKNIVAVQSILDKEVLENGTLRSVNAGPVVTLITPTIIPTNMGEASQNSGRFNIELSAIYWSPHDPIVTIDRENYQTGDLVLGHRIVEIRKTEVVFEDPLGEKVVKYFYDFLGDSKR